MQSRNGKIIKIQSVHAPESKGEKDTDKYIRQMEAEREKERELKKREKREGE